MMMTKNLNLKIWSL